MKCYFKSEPSKRGYRKRMLTYWRELGVFSVSEQRLADQARAIKTNEWLTDIEIEEIKRMVCTEEEPADLPTINEVPVPSESTREDPIVEVHREEESNIQFEAIEGQINTDEFSEDNTITLNMLLDELRKKELEAPQNLRNVERSRLKEEAANVSGDMQFFMEAVVVIVCLWWTEFKCCCQPEEVIITLV